VAHASAQRIWELHSRCERLAIRHEQVVLRTFPTVIEADLAKSALDSVGIDSMVRSDNEGGQAPGLAFSQGVELLVSRSQLPHHRLLSAGDTY